MKGRTVAENSFEVYSGDDVSQCDTLCSAASILSNRLLHTN